MLDSDEAEKDRSFVTRINVVIGFLIMFFLVVLIVVATYPLVQKVPADVYRNVDETRNTLLKKIEDNELHITELRAEVADLKLRIVGLQEALIEQE